MAIQRQPGDVSVKRESRTVYWEYFRNGALLASGSDTWDYIRDYRPAYPMGAVVELPGGLLFRKATSYSRESWEVKEARPATMDGYQTLPGWDGHYRASDGGRDGSLFLAGNPHVIGLNVPISNRNEAVTKALNKIADQKVNLGENLATLRQTASMFVKNGDSLVSALNSIWRNKSMRPFLTKSYRDLRREGIPEAIAGRYLEYIYGLKPLVEDAFTLAEEMKKSGKKTMIFSATGKSSGNVQGKPATPMASNSVIYRTAPVAEFKVNCSLWAQINPEWSGLRALNQYGLLNPFGLAWDLVPWSFVVDWFVPVGPVLYALTAPAGLDFVSGSISMRNSERSEYIYGISAGFLYNPDRVANQKTSFPLHYEGYTRQALHSWPLPGLWIAPDPLKMDRPLKALALSIQQLKSKR